MDLLEIPCGYCQCGCGEKTRIHARNRTRNNERKGQPKNFLPGHYRKMLMIPWEERFWKKVHKAETCWLWQGTIDQHGYGTFALTARKNIGAHRLMWILMHGHVPESLFVLHRCLDKANPLCVNPAHLYVGTQYENVQDSLREGTHIALIQPNYLRDYVVQHPEVLPRGEDHKNSKLTEQAVREIRMLYPSLRTTALAQRYNVSVSTIAHVIHKTDWRDV